ncbi:hypothetical protein MaudCBS49596_003098 [Microsporum audouinii]
MGGVKNRFSFRNFRPDKYTPSLSELREESRGRRESAFLSAARRTDRSLEDRLASAKNASKCHYANTGSWFVVTREAILNNDEFEETPHKPDYGDEPIPQSNSPGGKRRRNHFAPPEPSPAAPSSITMRRPEFSASLPTPAPTPTSASAPTSAPVSAPVSVMGSTPAMEFDPAMEFNSAMEFDPAMELDPTVLKDILSGLQDQPLASQGEAMVPTTHSNPPDDSPNSSMEDEPFDFNLYLVDKWLS